MVRTPLSFGGGGRGSCFPRAGGLRAGASLLEPLASSTLLLLQMVYDGHGLDDEQAESTVLMI